MLTRACGLCVMQLDRDLMKNPLIVPLKILRGHEVSGGLGVMSVAFHPVLVRRSIRRLCIIICGLSWIGSWIHFNFCDRASV